MKIQQKITTKTFDTAREIEQRSLNESSVLSIRPRGFIDMLQPVNVICQQSFVICHVRTKTVKKSTRSYSQCENAADLSKWTAATVFA